MTDCPRAVNCDPVGPTPEPVLPRCQDVVLVDGTYVNATVVVNNGCIVLLTEGDAPLYQPDPCCAPVGGGGGGGGSGLPGPRGFPGDDATITIGTVATGAPGSQATVQNVGTQNDAVFNFVIPQGPAGAGGTAPFGLTGNFTGLVLQTGLVQALPLTWPPVLQAIGFGAPAGVAVTATKDINGNLEVSVDISAYDADIRADFQLLIDNMQLQIDTLTAKVTALCNGQPCP